MSSGYTSSPPLASAWLRGTASIYISFVDKDLLRFISRPHILPYGMVFSHKATFPLPSTKYVKACNLPVTNNGKV